MSDWSTAPLTEILEFREGPGIMAVDFRNEGVPLIRLAGLKRGAGLLNGCNYLDPVKVERKWKQFRLREGDVLLSTSASLGEVATVVDEGVGGVPYTGIICFRPRDRRVDPLFIQHMLTAPSFKAQIEAMGVGSVMKHFGPSHLRNMSVSYPDIQMQRAIIEVLGALDNKIAANDRLISAVDEYLACEFARLCTGRASGTLKNIAAVNTGVARPTVDGKLRYLDISAVSEGSYIFPALTKWEQAPGRARRLVRAGDTVWSTVRPNRRSHALVLDDDPILVGSTGLAVLSPKKGRIACTYECARRREFAQYLERVAEGSAYPAVRADRFSEAPIPALRDDEWDHYESTALPLRRRSHAATVENRSLTAMRDELLPLLMSGKVRVRDVEKVVEGVV